jgi:hypothetical protein
MSAIDRTEAEPAEFAARLQVERAEFAARLRADFDVRSPDRLENALRRFGFDVTSRGLQLALKKSGYSLREAASLSLPIVIKTLEARAEAQDRIKDQAVKRAPSALRKATRAPENRPPQRQQWLTERQFAEQFGLARQTLSNWRYRDKQSGRTEAAPDFPTYRRFGKTIRYLVEDGQPKLNRPNQSKDAD